MAVITGAGGGRSGPICGGCAFGNRRKKRTPTKITPIEPVMLADVAEASVERARRRGEGQITLAATPSPVMGRPASLERAIDNLLDNAQKWDHSGEPIELDVANGRVTVRDHGPGIPTEEQPRIFDRFYRSVSARSEPGSGLGLSIVKQILQAHGETVHVESTKGRGTRFWFELPLAEAVETTQEDGLHEIGVAISAVQQASP